MNRTLRTAATTIVLALVLGPGASAGTPTTATWAAAANAVCASGNAGIRALPKPTTPALLVGDIRKTLTLAQHLTSRLAQIPRPPAESRAIGTLLSVSRTQNSIVAQRLLPALVRGDQAAATSAGNALGPLDTRFNRLARSLGARVCAENPAPAG